MREWISTVFSWTRRKSRRLLRSLRRKVFVLSVLRDWIAVERVLRTGLNLSNSDPEARLYGCKNCRVVFEVGKRCYPYLGAHHCINCSSRKLVYFNVAGLFSSTGERMKDWLEGRNHGKEEEDQPSKRIRLVAKNGNRLH